MLVFEFRLISTLLAYIMFISYQKMVQYYIIFMSGVDRQSQKSFIQFILKHRLHELILSFQLSLIRFKKEGKIL